MNILCTPYWVDHHPLWLHPESWLFLSGAMFLLFAGLVGLTVLVLFVWAGTMVYRLYNPECPRGFDESAIVRRERATAGEKLIPMGVEEVRTDRRRELRTLDQRRGYVFGCSGGIPEAWHRDLWDRRN